MALIKVKLKYIKLPIFTLTLAIILAVCGLSYYPHLVEQYYSTGFYPGLASAVSLISAYIPFSFAEFLFIEILVIVLYMLVSRLFAWKRTGRAPALKQFIIKLLLVVSVVYCLFMVMWGINYHRQPFAVIAGLDTSAAAVEELTDLCENLADRAGTLRGHIEEDEAGVMIISGAWDIFQRASKGYNQAAGLYPELGGNFGIPKGVGFSEVMAWTGVWGIYSPFTAEANVNTILPHVALPYTTCHEMAHQRGFAREDEANYIAWLTCSLHPDADFQYSGTVMALKSSLQALAAHDLERAQLIADNLDEGVKRDLIDIQQFSLRYSGRLARATSKVNDAYLKANSQSEGIYSYGRMVDLLIAEQRQKQLDSNQ